MTFISKDSQLLRVKAWIYSNSSSKASPYNDYDILVICENKPSEDIKRLIRKDILAVVDIKWIDIDYMTALEFQKMKISIYSYDIKNASRIIYGDETILDLLPDYDNRKIKLYEVEKLFFTRLWPFFGSLGPDGFRNLSIDEASFFRYQMSKVLLSVLDSKLVDNKSYVCSYKNKLKISKNLYPESNWIKKFGDWALKEKLSPTQENMGKNEVMTLYNEVYSIYKNEMFIILNKLYKIGVFPTNYKINMLFLPYYMFRRLYIKIILRSNSFEKELKIRESMLHAFLAFNYNIYDMKMINKAKKAIDKMLIGKNINDINDLYWQIALLRKDEIK